LKSLERIGLAPNILHTYVIGKEGYEIIKQLGYECDLIDDEPLSNFQTFRKGNWVDIMFNKFTIIYENLLKYKYVCFTDGDIVFENANFLEYLKNNIESYDMLIQEDYNCHERLNDVCAGFMCIKSNEKTISLFNPEFVKQYKITENWDDQIYINGIKHNLNYKCLPLDLFPNGKYYYNNSNLTPYLIHFNWLTGHDKKIAMKHYGKWYNDITLPNQPKKYALTFGGGEQKYRDASSRVSNEILQTNLFDKVITYTDQELQNDDDFWKKNQEFIENNRKGYGFWLWKPYIIMKIMHTMKDNDILVYLDSGCVVVNEPIKNEYFDALIKRCNEHQLVYTSAYYLEKLWTKMDLLTRLNMVNYDTMNTIQHQATFLIIKKNELMMDFITDWYNICQNYHNIDEISILQNYILFEEHRHDQSAFSLLIKSDKYKDAINNEDNVIHNSYPFILCRHRSGDNKIF
jgi:hypothetical protein